MIVCIIFKETDTDGSGSIDAKELKALITTISESEVGEKLDPPKDEEVAGYLKELDASGDGTIDFKEFAHFMVPMIIAASMDE